MPISEQLIKKEALARAADTLSNSAIFGSLSESDQREMLKQTYAQQYDQLSQALSGAITPTSLAMATNPPKPQKASDLIDDKRHENRRIDQAGQLAGGFVREVNFPQFVKDLLTGVFDANLKVTLEQMAKYQELLKTATQSIAKYAQAVKPADAFGYLAENSSDEFGLDFSDEEEDDDGNPKAILTDKSGNPVDTEDSKIKAKIMDATLALAKEQRKLLRETILMGITRLVVEKGTVKASVIFDMKASEKIQKTDKAGMKRAYSKTSSQRAGLFGRIFGGGGGSTSSFQESQISVSSAKSESNTDLAAKLMGSVDITFKSDYFKLDNFLEIEKTDIEADKAVKIQQGQLPPPQQQAAPAK